MPLEKDSGGLVCLEGLPRREVAGVSEENSGHTVPGLICLRR